MAWPRHSTSESSSFSRRATTPNHVNFTSTMTKLPQVSIGMPVYNAGNHIGLAIEGLLAQSFGDFELIVSDNASSDSTRDVVEEYKQRDDRIRYERQPANIGANANYSYVVRRARGEFFKWSSASDWCAPTFLEHCRNELLAHGDTVLAVPKTRLFCDSLDTWQDYAWDIEVLDDASSARLARLTAELALNNAMNGLIRTSALRRTRLIEAYLSADVVLMGHLALLGKFRLLNERLLYRRMAVATATSLQDRAAVWRHHYPQLTARTLFQGSKRQVGWIRAALSVPMPIGERARALKHIAKGCFWERKVFMQDLRGVWHYFVRRTWPH